MCEQSKLMKMQGKKGRDKGKFSLQDALPQLSRALFFEQGAQPQHWPVLMLPEIPSLWPLWVLHHFQYRYMCCRFWILNLT
jgi:hypothetical protein